MASPAPLRPTREWPLLILALAIVLAVCLPLWQWTSGGDETTTQLSKWTPRRVARLRFFTEDGFPEVYLLLKHYTDENGREWVQIRVPKRPNGRKGWVPRDALG